MGGGVIVVLLALYFIPALVAYNRGHHNQNAIFVLNLFLGWTFIFWVISLVWACTAVNEPEPKKLGGILGRIEQQKAARERENERAKWAALSSEPPPPKVEKKPSWVAPFMVGFAGVAGLAVFGTLIFMEWRNDLSSTVETTSSIPEQQSTVIKGLTPEQTKKLDDLMPVASDGQVGSIPRRSEEATATAPVATPLATAPVATPAVTAPVATAPVATPAVTAPVAGIKVATVAPYVIQVGIKHNQRGSGSVCRPAAQVCIPFGRLPPYGAKGRSRRKGHMVSLRHRTNCRQDDRNETVHSAQVARPPRLPCVGAIT
jgi:hypothetical protein